MLYEAVEAPGNSAAAPYPATLQRLMDIADRPSQRQKYRQETLMVAYANLTVARYFLHHMAIPSVSMTVHVPCLLFGIWGLGLGSGPMFSKTC